MDQVQLEELPLREAQEVLSRLRSLMAHPGWTYFQQLGDVMKLGRLSSLANKLDSMDAVIGEQFEKGVIKGLQLMQEAPLLYCVDLEKLIATKLTEEGHEHGPSNDGPEPDLDAPGSAP